MQTYVAGFLFRQHGEQVALIEKLKPDWQKGKLNAIGGKVEEGETMEAAIQREFCEETGALVLNWREFCVLSGPDFRVYFYTSHVTTNITLQSMEEEKVGWYYIGTLKNYPILFNLRWLIPLALDPEQPWAVIENKS